MDVISAQSHTSTISMDFDEIWRDMSIKIV
jgi:hypothetical protein